MPADFNQPTLTSPYASFLTYLADRDISAITLCKDDPSNIPTYAKKYERALNKFQEWDGAAWNDLILSIAGGGTGAATAAGSRAALGLGTIAVQDANAVAITGGTIAGVSANANIITAGLIAQARLGTGSGGAGLKFLADDQTYKDGVPVGLGFEWYTNVAPSGYLICDGSAINRVTYAALFAVIGTTWGAGDGSTTFNLPDRRQRVGLGKAASGTGATLAGTGGTIDHTHTGPSHTHTVASHTHTGPSHTHTVPFSGWINESPGIFYHDRLVIGIDMPDSDGNFNVTYFANTANTSGASGTGATGGTALTTDASGTGATGSNNMPYVVVNYIIKY